MSEKMMVKGVELELVAVGFQTHKHCCSGCYFYENDIVCDEYIEVGPSCHVTRIFKEVK